MKFSYLVQVDVNEAEVARINLSRVKMGSMSHTPKELIEDALNELGQIKWVDEVVIAPVELS